ncbi:MAG: ABC transporter permease [Phycisphaerae bacterium]|nr:ABC transporter permease [Phycisphaerae bacterium]NUQ47557.1 ABC transporter permease [Phycisphaerae bacterium]
MHTAERIQELWRFREVVKNFVAQNLKVKYRRSILGFFWSLLNPLLQMIVITIVFSLIFRFGVRDYALYVLSGLIPWAFFSTSIDNCTLSIIGAEHMLRRQYFPKLVFPVSMVLQNLVTFALSLIVLLIVLAPVSGFNPLQPALLILPLSFACIVCVALGVGALAALITVYFRDMQHLIAVLISAWFYVTPIIYPLEAKPRAAKPPAVATAPADPAEAAAALEDAAPIPHAYRVYFKLNPMYSIIEMFHRPIYDGRLPTPSELTAALATAAACLVGGVWIFWRFEDRLIFAL